MNRDELQYAKMTQTPVGPLITSLAIPTIISMLVTAIYNIGDTYFVSKLGTSASGAVGIVFSLMAIIQSVGFTIGMGSGARISRLLGAQRTDDANAVAASGFCAAVVLGSLLTVFGLLFLDPLMRVLGATSTILPYARDYARYILFAAPVMAASFLLNNILRAEGKARLAMVGLTSGGILNLLLDPLFIFTFDMGIAGAAIATALSQCVSFGILLSWFLAGKTITRPTVARISRRPDAYLKILKNGFPSFCRQGLASIATIALNVSAAVYGDAAVAAMSIVGKIFMFVFAINLGIGQGYMPVVGYNYGAGQYGRVKAAFLFTLKVACVLMTASAIAGFLSAPSLIRFFIETHAGAAGDLPRHAADPVGRRLQHDLPVHRKIADGHIPVHRATGILLPAADPDPAPMHRPARRPDHAASGRRLHLSALRPLRATLLQGTGRGRAGTTPLSLNTPNPPHGAHPPYHVALFRYHSHDSESRNKKTEIQRTQQS